MTDQIQLIASRIMELREIAAISAESFANYLNVEKGTLLEYESGRTDIPVGSLFREARWFDLELSALLRGDQPKLHVYAVVRKGKGLNVESALMEHPAVLECAITAVPDEDRGQVVKATIILSKNYSASDALAKELQEHVKKVTAPYKYPRIVEFVTQLPKTISGKIRRVQIGEEDQQE